MATDDEKRRVAEMLRKSDGPSLMVLMSALGVGGDRVLDRLAGLIEPSCDRDALLALADKLECDGECDGCDMSDGIWCDAQGYAARRIREACGEAGR